MAFPLALKLVRLWSQLPELSFRRRDVLALPRADDDDRRSVLIIPRSRDRISMLRPILERLADPDDGHRLVMAGGFGLGLPDSIHRTISPGHSLRRTRELLAALRPVMVIVVGDPFLPAMTEAASEAGIPLTAFDIRSGRNGWPIWTLARTSAEQVLQSYVQFMTPEPVTQRRLRRLGASADKIERTGPFAELVEPPHYRPEERESLKDGLGARPVWCAVDVPDEECEIVLQAFDRAARRAHRLLLVIMPRNPTHLEGILAAVKAAGLPVMVRSDGDDPDVDTSVYIADIWEEHGLWFSLANVTYLGGSISPVGAIRSPMEPASLGCAVVHGTNYGSHGQSFAVLQAAGASIQVTSSNELADAIDTLSTPDAQANLVAKAWQMATSTADIAERLHALIRRYE